MNSWNPSRFTMAGARKASDTGLAHIQQQIEALEEAVYKENPGLVFDMARSLLESVCKAILTEKGVPYETNWSLPKPVKTVLDQLVLVSTNVTGGDGASDSLRKISGSLTAVVQGLVELRNDFGFASHGKEPGFHGLDMVHALSVARSADSIIDFLHTLHRFPFAELEQPLEFKDNPDYNEYIDSENGEMVQINIFGDIFEFRPSEVLYSLDPQAYESYLEIFRETREETDGELVV